MGEGLGIKCSIEFESYDIANAKLQKILQDLQKNNHLTLDLDKNAVARIQDELKKLEEKFKDSAEKSKKSMRDIYNSNDITQMLQQRKKEIESLVDTVANIKINTNNKDEVQSAFITYTDNVGKAITETYKWQTSIKETESEILKVHNFQLTNSAYSDNIQKSINLLNKFEQQLQSLKSNNNNVGGDNSSFASQYESIINKVNELKLRGTAITKEEKDEIASQIGLLQQLNTQQKQNVKTEQESKDINNKILQTQQEMRTKLQSLQDKYKGLVPTKELQEFQVALNGINANNMKDLNTKIKDLRIQFNQLVADTKSSGLNTANTDKASIFQGLATDLQKFGLWVGTGSIVMGVIRSFKSGISDIMELDNQLNVISITMNGTTEQFQQLGESSQQMAKDIGISVSEVMEVAKVYANMNETVDSILAKSKASVMLSAVSGNNSTNITDSMQSIINQYELAGQDIEKVSMDISDSLISISKNLGYDFGRGIQQITEGVQVSGSVMKEAGFTYQQTEAILGKLIETTRLGGSQIGNAMRMIASRMGSANTGEATAEDISKAEKAYKELGITLRDTQGNMKVLPEIMNALHEQWGSMTTQQKNFISEVSAGQRQRNIFLNMMNSWADSTNLYQQALQSTGETEKATEKYSESARASIERLKASVTTMWQQMINSSVIKGLLSFINGGINGISTLTSKLGGLGSTIGIVSTILGVRFVLSARKAQMEVIQLAMQEKTLANGSIINGLKIVGNNILGVGTASNVASHAMMILNLKTALFTAGITLIPIVIGKIIERFEKLKQVNEEVINAFNQNTKTNNDFINYLQQEGKAYDSLKDKTNLTKEEQEKLSQIKERLTQQFPELIQGYDSETGQIILQKKSTAELIEMLKQKNKLENDKLLVNGDNALKDTVNQYKEAQKEIDKYKEKAQKLKDGGDNVGKGDLSYKSTIDGLLEASKIRKLSADEQELLNKKQIEYADLMKQINIEYSKQKEVIGGLQPYINAIYNDKGLDEFEQKLANMTINWNGLISQDGFDFNKAKTEVQQFIDSLNNDKSINEIKMFTKIEKPNSKDIDDLFNAVEDVAKKTNAKPLTIMKELKIDPKAIDSYIKDLEEKLNKATGQAKKDIEDKLNLASNIKVQLEAEGGQDTKNSIDGVSEAEQKLTEDIETHGDAIKTLTSAIKEYNDNGRLSLETVVSLLDKYPELNSVIAQGGDIYDFLMKKQTEEVNNQRTALNLKLMSNADFSAKIMAQNSTWVNDMSQKYGVDLKNFATLQEAKVAILKKLGETISNTNEAYLDFMEGKTDMSVAQYEALAKTHTDAENKLKSINADFSGIVSKYTGQIKGVGDSLKGLSSSGSSKSSSPSSKSPSSKSPSSSSSKSSQTYTFNGAEVDEYQSQLQTVEDSLQKIDDKISEINQLKSNAESIDSESNYSEILKIQNQLLDEQINKQNTLNSKHDEVSELKNTIKEDIWKNWGKLRGKDLSKLTQTDWDDYLTQFYGKDRTFKNEADKKRYDVGLKKFQQLVKDYQDTTNKLNEIDDERLKQVEVVNNAIKDKWEAQINVYNDVFNKQSKDIDELSTRLDFANRSDESSIRNRLDIMYELISKKEENLRQIYKTRDELLEQQKSLKEGSLEWDLINDTVETYNANIKDATNSLLDQKDILSQSIQEMTDTAVSMYDKVYNALVKKYDKEKEDELAKIDEELKQSTEKEDGLIKLYNAKIENLKAELDRLKDETKDEQDILNAKKSELELWKKDDSIFAQGKIQELEKDIADKEKDLKIKAKEQELKEEEEKLKDVTESYDKRKEEKEKYYDNTLKDEKKLHEETRKIMQGSQDEILNLLYKYDERYASLGELLGSSFTNPFLEELEKAKKALEDLKLINKEIEQEKIKESLKTSTVVNVSNNGKTANMSDGSKVDLGGLYSNSEYRALGQKWLDAKESGDTASAQKYEQQARDYASKYASFDTGGMTGSWGGEGKLAVLHEKELILNKTDTENMLKALNVSQSLVDTFKNIVMPNIANNISFKLPDISKLTSKPLNTYNSPLVENKIYMTNNTPFEVDNNMDNMNRAIVKQLGLAGVNTPL